MPFLSVSFAVFFAMTALVYYLCPARWQNPILLAANLVFYLWSSPQAALVLAAATVAAYWTGRYLQKHPGNKPAVWLACLFLFGMLFFYKYMNSCLDLAFAVTGAENRLFSEILIPVGVSFFVFSLSAYVFDVYRGKQTAERRFVDFAVFASYFPSIQSGPINRAGAFLPQLREQRKFDAEGVKRGVLRFCFGLFRKVLISDQLGILVGQCYADPAAYASAVWCEVILLYSLQLYLDFSAYSDMAIGASLVLGIRLRENFSAPYLSTTVKDFWKKWHISLTSWFRDYLYIPLGGSRRGRMRTYLNILVVFAVSGIWHGAGLTFLLWGLLNGLYQVAEAISMPYRDRILSKLRISPSSRAISLIRGCIVFVLISFAWVLFRSENLGEAWFIFRRCLLVVRNGLSGYVRLLPSRSRCIALLLGLGICLGEDIRISRGKPSTLPQTTFRYYLTLAVLLSTVLLFGTYGTELDAREFIYFQF